MSVGPADQDVAAEPPVRGSYWRGGEDPAQILPVRRPPVVEPLVIQCVITPAHKEIDPAWRPGDGRRRFIWQQARSRSTQRVPCARPEVVIGPGLNDLTLDVVTKASQHELPELGAPDGQQ